MKDVIKINEKDNVIVALHDLKKGNTYDGITLLEDINRGHKIAITDIKENSNVVKYGMVIGHATRDIKKGEHVHVHNVKTNLSDIIEYKYNPHKIDIKKPEKSRKVNVYKRKDGQYGIRNEIWIIQTVACVSQQAKTIIERFKERYDTSKVDGIYTFDHPYGCSQLGDDHNTTKETLQNMVRHPNAGAVLILGLGCENNQVPVFLQDLNYYDSNRLRYLIIQNVEDEIEAGVKLLKELYNEIKDDKREEADISVLKVGLKCGGSDGLSGITANPLLGKFSDYLTSLGGTTIMAEVPEFFGAEQLLMNRAKNIDIYNKTVKMINDFKNYFIKHDQVIYENPSPGNKEGGITTLEDKSLGNIQKSGSNYITDILNITERIKEKGVNLISTPGNDLVSATAMAQAGAQLILFTTGRGTPYGTFVPTIKVGTNTEISTRKKNWIDFNAGKLVEDISMDELLENFIDLIVDVVNGKKTNNELNNFRQIAIFKFGVTL